MQSGMWIMHHQSSTNQLFFTMFRILTTKKIAHLSPGLLALLLNMLGFKVIILNVYTKENPIFLILFFFFSNSQLAIFIVVVIVSRKYVRMCLFFYPINIDLTVHCSLSYQSCI